MEPISVNSPRGILITRVCWFTVRSFVTISQKTASPIHTADETKLFCRVGDGGVNTIRKKLTTTADGFGRQF